MIFLELWLWGLVASTIIDIPISLRIRNNIKKNNPEFLEYYKNRSKMSNFMHNVKSFGKLLLPGLNIVYPFWLFTKRFFLGYNDLSDSLIQKIKDYDYKKYVLKSKFQKVIDKLHRCNNKKNQVDNVVKPNTSKIVTPIKNEDIQSVTSNKDLPAFEDKSKSKYESLYQYFDKLNSSNISTDILLQFYKKEYWSIRKEYDELIQSSKDASDAKARFTIVYQKAKELKELRNSKNNGPVLDRK